MRRRLVPIAAGIVPVLLVIARVVAGATGSGGDVAVDTTSATAGGRFDMSNAFSLPDLTGNNQLIVVGQQSQKEVTATFATAAPTPTGN